MYEQDKAQPLFYIYPTAWKSLSCITKIEVTERSVVSLILYSLRKHYIRINMPLILPELPNSCFFRINNFYAHTKTKISFRQIVSLKMLNSRYFNIFPKDIPCWYISGIKTTAEFFDISSLPCVCLFNSVLKTNKKIPCNALKLWWKM